MVSTCYLNTKWWPEVNNLGQVRFQIIFLITQQKPNVTQNNYYMWGSDLRKY